MICYQDEKMYGPPADDVTIDELNSKIRNLEMKLYGKTLSDHDCYLEKKPMIYDTKNGTLVERT